MKIQFQSDKFTVFESTLYRTTTTLVNLDKTVLLVDPNWLPIEIDFLKKFILDNFSGKKINILFTHSDYDHIIGYGAFDYALTIGSEAFSLSANKESVIQQIFDFDNEYYISRNYPVSFPELDIIIKGVYETIHIDGTSIHFYKAPGHNDDGIFTIIPEIGIWIAGDYLSNIEIPMIDGSYRDYITTLKKAKEIFNHYPSLNFLIPGHGDIAFGRDQILQRIHNDTEYLSLLQEAKNERSDLENGAINALIVSYNANPQMIRIHDNNIKKLKSDAGI